ncbi:MAG: class I SAM-dependent methyltransferase [Actinobacteria bacterium]|nr:class I SAM-dependent methyltransferase [Actinomycetota bacterium]
MSADSPAPKGIQYYSDKTESLKDMLGAQQVTLTDTGIDIDGQQYPIVDDVILMMPFGAEWTTYPRVLPEHRAEFDAYFDAVNLESLARFRVVDLGCGIGRWAYFIAARCREVVLVDYSEAIFAARSNLADQSNAIFILGDVLDLPFRDDAFDFAYCLGVLHHLPVDALEACRRLSSLAPLHLVYLYYALDNRPAYFRVLLRAVTEVRQVLARLPPGNARTAITWLIAATVYAPAAALGRALRPFGLERYVPLADAHSHDSLRRIRQDVYDRFFTSIEQRFTREEILSLRDTFGDVDISQKMPYWHFTCRRDGAQPETAPQVR